MVSQQDIKKEAVSYFQKFLQSQDSTTEDVSLEQLQDLLTYRCSNAEAAVLVGPVTAKEIQAALLELPNDKVSGPDGFTKDFLSQHGQL